jgi:proton glutamate symport protein
LNGAVLKHPAAILFGVVIGTLIGLFNAPISDVLGIPNFAGVIAFPGQLYLFYLQMTVIPIIITAISSSLGKLIRNKNSAGLIKKIVFVFFICMIGCALAGMGIGFFGNPGSGLDEDTRSLLAKLISSTEQEGISGALEINLSSSYEPSAAVERPSMANFFKELIPSNIFRALSLGSTMGIVFFSIIFGVAIGSLQEQAAEMLIDLFSAIFQTFQKLINWSLYLLPFGLICLLAGQVAAVGIQIFMAMSKFITLFCIGTGLIFIICTIIIWFRSGISNPFKVIAFLFEPILLAFGTRNSMATLPSAIACLDAQMKFNATAVNLTLPLGMTLGRFGNIFYFGLAVFFVVQIYNTPLELMYYFIILIGVILGGTATAGASGIVTLSMLSIVLDPLSLPIEAVLIIFMAIDPIIDPFRTFLIVYVNMAATTLVAAREGRNRNDDTAQDIPFENLQETPEMEEEPKIEALRHKKSEFDELQYTGQYERLTERKGFKKQFMVYVEEMPVQQTNQPENTPDQRANQPAGSPKPFVVYIQRSEDLPPFLYRRSGTLQGLEIEFLREVVRRLDRPLVLKDRAFLNGEEQAKIEVEADLIAGVIKRTEVHPKGFCFSRAWLAVKEPAEKKLLCFLLPPGSSESVRIDSIIKNLRTENFLKPFVE